ncbi:hypothetical protein V2J09_014337 [Rumex salicifolius]
MELDKVREQEETLWFHKSREKWVALGDRNTSFFHMSTIIRRRRNGIEMLKGDDESTALKFYRRLYSTKDILVEFSALPREGFMRLTQADRNELEKLYTITKHATLDRMKRLDKHDQLSIRGFRSDEKKATLSHLGRFKALGPNGYQPDVVGQSVTKFVLDFFETGQLPISTNEALLVLIAKVKKPERINQFRPISLCNVLFKTITKAMVIHLKSVISKLIGSAQSSFIPGSLSTNNIVAVQETVHSMRRRKGRKG